MGNTEGPIASKLSYKISESHGDSKQWVNEWFKKQEIPSEISSRDSYKLRASWVIPIIFLPLHRKKTTRNQIQWAPSLWGARSGMQLCSQWFEWSMKSVPIHRGKECHSLSLQSVCLDCQRQAKLVVPPSMPPASSKACYQLISGSAVALPM